MLKDVVRRKFDLVGVTAIDRLGRSFPELLTNVADLHAASHSACSMLSGTIIDNDLLCDVAENEA
jgi:DNA invertase Pin-like site-specific DNA recombinase